MMQSELIKQKLAEEYWVGKLSGIIPHCTGSALMNAGEFTLSEKAKRSVSGISNNNSLAAFTIHIAAYSFVASRYLGVKEVVVSAVPPGENNLVFLRLGIDDSQPLKTLLLQAREEVIRSIRYSGIADDTLLNILKNYEEQKGIPVLSFGNCEERSSAYGTVPVLAIGTKNDDRRYIAVQHEIEGIFSATHFVSSYDHILANLKDFLDIKAADVNILDTAAENELIRTFSGKITSLPETATVCTLFGEQAALTPGAIAVRHADLSITYSELDEVSGRLAWHLKHEYALQPGSRTAILIDRSIDAIICMLAAFKAGLIYIPVDTAYPQSRINYILKDAQVSLVMTQTDYLHLLEEFGGSIFAADVQLSGLDAPVDRENNPVSQESGAYIIYTSGSTGNPKGCIISHRNLLNYILWVNQYYFVEPSEGNFALLTSLAFDLTITSIFSPLTRGRSVHVFSGGIEDMLLSAMQCADVDALKLTPSHINLLGQLNISNPAAKIVIAGGEALTLQHIRILEKIAPVIRVYNEYGPTETTVGCIACQVKGTDKRVLVGRPIANTRVLILDKLMRLCPVGATGEIYIGGAGVSLGYMNRGELNKERFVNLPFTGEERFYRTGDFGRWNENGEIDYLGRNDEQVKIRGYRIETGEIVHALHSVEGITQAFVMVNEPGEGGGGYLLAFICPASAPPDAAILNQLRMLLPEYMVPFSYTRLDALPLTANGKVDKKVLLGYAERSAARTDHVDPGNEIEQLLADTWKEILGTSVISINDSFFALGGDSIKAIQISSRLYKAGYKMDLGLLFEHPTIAALAPVISPITVFSDQGIITGEVRLTPIQSEFFGWSKVDSHFYNQTVMLKIAAIDTDVITAIFLKLLAHHDSLRTVFHRNSEGDIVQEMRSPGQPVNIEVIDLQGKGSHAAAMLKEEIARLQSSLVLSEGLVRLGMFRMDDGNRLLIVIHHLVVDGVSWRILLEDIQTLFGQATSGQELSLPPKTDSYRKWSEALTEYSRTEALLKQLEYWTSVASMAESNLPQDMPGGSNTVRDIATSGFSLGKEQTQLLTTTVNNAFNTEINDILLTALGLAVYEVFGIKNVVVAMEGHGRAEILPGINVSRTVGWFTCIYPLVIPVSSKDDLALQIKRVKETFRKVPQNGIGYGILKNLTGEKERIGVRSSISFNYLGGFDNIADEGDVGIAPEDTGEAESFDRERPYEFDIVGMITGGELRFTFSYSNRQYYASTVERLCQNFCQELSRIISFCSGRTEAELTPSDLTYKELDIDTLDTFFDE